MHFSGIHFMSAAALIAMTTVAGSECYSLPMTLDVYHTPCFSVLDAMLWPNEPVWHCSV